jgi:hypothetical protein
VSITNNVTWGDGDDRGATESVVRWVLTHVNLAGLRTLTNPTQGRYTHATYRDADDELRAFLRNNGVSTLATVFGPQSLGTFEVRPVDCWPVHFDPKGVYFEA